MSINPGILSSAEYGLRKHYKEVSSILFEGGDSNEVLNRLRDIYEDFPKDAYDLPLILRLKIDENIKGNEKDKKRKVWGQAYGEVLRRKEEIDLAMDVLDTVLVEITMENRTDMCGGKKAEGFSFR
ncbi:MAG: hypothetical protein WC926_00825 [Candidatus Paceibacterota bacterium]|jgi:hypothetical protein